MAGHLQKIAISTLGSRGDVQPYIALALGLQEAGYTVKIFTNENHKNFVEEFGVEMVPCFNDTEVVLKSGKGFEAILGNPVRSQGGLPNLPCCGLNAAVMKKVYFKEAYDMWRNHGDPVVQKIHGVKVTDAYTWNMYMNDQRGEGSALRLIAQSGLLADILYPGAPPAWQFCGQFIIPSDQQHKHAQKKDSESGGGSTVELIENFMRAGASPPVYIGWGSMVSRSPEFMVKLLVQALMHCGQRAVVLRGWAQLSMELLVKATQDKEVIEFAEKNVLFVKSAPHKWLFPKCACTVHHAGAGTFGAALRAGVPMIVTPCFLDQHDHSYAVRRLGCGVGFKKVLNKMTAVELGNAIKKCVSDPDVARRSKEIATQICSESGVPVAVRHIEEFWGRQHAAPGTLLSRPAAKESVLV